VVSSPNDTDPTLRRDASGPPHAKPETLETATRKLKSEWHEAFTALKRALYLEKQAFGLKLFDVAFRVAVVVCGGFTVIALSIAGALLLVIGARRGLAVWTNDAWWADLVLGAMILGILGLAAHLSRRAVHRGTLARAQAHLGLAPEPDPDVPAHLVPPTKRSAH